MNSSGVDSDQLKAGLRVRMQARLASVEAEQGAKWTERIFERVIRLPEYERAKSILSFVSMAREVGTHNLIRHSILLGKSVCVPAFDREQKKYFVVGIEDFERDLRVGYFGILEPRDAKPTEAQADLALVPGLAFDKQGNRLGRGKGYFDALLRDFRGVKAALAFDFQVTESVPVDDQDVAMDLIVTEERVIRMAG